MAGRPCSTNGVRGIGLPEALFRLVSRNDLLNDGMPDDIPFVERHEPDLRNMGENPARLPKAGSLALRQIDLGYVSRDDGFGEEPDPSEEHLHLLGRRVLRLIEDD